MRLTVRNHNTAGEVRSSRRESWFVESAVLFQNNGSDPVDLLPGAWGAGPALKSVFLPPWPFWLWGGGGSSKYFGTHRVPGDARPGRVGLGGLKRKEAQRCRIGC